MWLVLLILLTRPIITIIIFIWQICLHSSQTDNSIRFAMEGIHSLMNSKYAIDLSEAGAEGDRKVNRYFPSEAAETEKDRLDDDF